MKSLKKGRFRKGKKAYRSGSTRRIRLQDEYQRWLMRKEKARKYSLATVQAAIVSALGAVQIATISSRPIPRAQEDRQAAARERALAIAQSVINTATSVAKIFAGI